MLKKNLNNLKLTLECPWRVRYQKNVDFLSYLRIFFFKL